MSWKPKTVVNALSAAALLLSSIYGFGQLAQNSTVICSSRPAAEAPRVYHARTNTPDLKTLQHKAERGDPDMQFLMGRRYENGIGVRESSARAAKWYRKAAEQNLPRAQYNLGRLYASGEGFPQNYAEAMKWFHKAAAQDYPLAQNRLGVMYEKGQGVARDNVEAYKWFSLAAGTNQNVFAVANRESLAHRLTSEQLQEAQRRADSVLPHSSVSLAESMDGRQ
jgi:TPR repeat protein